MVLIRASIQWALAMVIPMGDIFVSTGEEQETFNRKVHSISQSRKLVELRKDARKQLERRPSTHPEKALVLPTVVWEDAFAPSSVKSNQNTINFCSISVLPLLTNTESVPRTRSAGSA